MFRRDRPEACLDMVCQRSRDRKGEAHKKSHKSLPLKKRMSEEYAPLTKESLDSMLPNQSHLGEARTVSVDDNRSVASTANSASTGALNGSQATAATPQASATVASSTTQSRFCTNSDIVKKALRRRDEEERLKVAKAMLYQSFLKAVNGSS